VLRNPNTSDVKSFFVNCTSRVGAEEKGPFVGIIGCPRRALMVAKEEGRCQEEANVGTDGTYPSFSGTIFCPEKLVNVHSKPAKTFPQPSTEIIPVLVTNNLY
jgi:hypothetical protein